jgi:orotate phosphoribosyltransferase
MELPILIDDPRFYDDKILTPEEILKWFDVYDAVWVYDSTDPKAPHAELHSGKCSNGFFDCMRVLRNPKLCEIFAFQLARELKEAGIKKVDWVIGSPYAAITFSHEVAKAFGAIHAFPEKDPSDIDGKKMVWRRMQIPKDAIVLQAEELVTTSDTFREVRRAVTMGNVEPINWLYAVGALIHRPPKLPVNYDGIGIVSLVEVEIWAVEQKDCPLCAIGSPRYRPKTNWDKLTGRA